MVDDVERESEADMMKAYLRAIVQEPRSPGAGQAYPSQESIPTFADMVRASNEQRSMHAEEVLSSAPATMTVMLDDLMERVGRMIPEVKNLNDRVSGEQPRELENHLEVAEGLHGRILMIRQLALFLETELQRLSGSL